MGKKKHEEHEEHENHERWLVSYADMMTLLMVLFVVMFAMSTVDQKKFNALKEGMAAGFGQSTSVLDGSSSILEEPGTSAAEPINPNRVEDSPEIQELKVQAASQAMRTRNAQEYAEAAGEADRLAALEDKVHKALEKAGLADDVRTKLDGRGLTVSLVSKHIVFQANLAELTPRGRRVVDTLAPILAGIDDKLQIEGHTNQAPGKPKYYDSDWDLAAARAVTVLRYLDERRGLETDRLAAVGYGHVKPLVDPSEPGSQELNKRVDIVVMSRLAAGSSSLLDQVFYERERAGRGGDAGRTGGTSGKTTSNHSASGTVTDADQETAHDTSAGEDH
ncbi:OmpA/MotB family protein [Nocardioides caldifontis]|uniref:OmpA/MotB family protein n=1 Tax=Nocardioides caldifontis TaxID=2588938 RepID=UPI0011E00F29|nr:flagellar motor protein MotB [Nocardioides caldifontis]